MSIRVKGNLRVRAALYAIGFFAGILTLATALTAIIPYIQPWMGWAVLFAFIFYCVYSLMLTKLEFDDSITKVKNIEDKPKVELLQE
jgi:predicted PurR-regulated permease PerM